VAQQLVDFGVDVVPGQHAGAGRGAHLRQRLRRCGERAPNCRNGGVNVAGREEPARAVVLDEFGGVDATDPGRCDRMLERYLLSRADLPPGRFHAFDLTRDLDEVCRQHESVVGAGCGLALLGVGTNGHVGMNEPGSSRDSLTRRVDLAPATVTASARYFSHDRLPTWGVTMGLSTLRRSREVWILASGPAKAAIMREVVHGPVTESVPESLAARWRSVPPWCRISSGQSDWCLGRRPSTVPVRNPYDARTPRQ